MYLIKMIKRKAHTGKEIIKITFGVIVVITTTFNIAGCVIKTKDLNMIDVLYAKTTKIKNSLLSKLLFKWIKITF